MIDNNIKSPRRVRSEKILDDIELHLRSLLKRKKELEKVFSTKLKELEKQTKENQDEFDARMRELDKQNEDDRKWFEDNWKEAERIENKLILLWDYWRREVEIIKLRKMEEGSPPTEREGILKEIQKLNALNITLEQGFKKRKIDAEVVTELRKRLGVWEEKEN